MAITRTKTVPATAQDNQEEANATPATPASGPVPVPNATNDKPKGKRGGYSGPRLFWGQSIDGSTNTLTKTIIEAARSVNLKYGGRATITDLVSALQSHPIFTNNKTAEGVPLSQLVNVTNIRNQWSLLRKHFTLQMAKKSVEEGGLGLDASVDKLSKDQFHAMEEQIAKPKDQGGRDFPLLVIMKGRKGGTGLNLDEI